MSTKSICDKCRWRWQGSGKPYCNLTGHKYTLNKKECNGFTEGRNDRYFKGKQGKNR